MLYWSVCDVMNSGSFQLKHDIESLPHYTYLMAGGGHKWSLPRQGLFLNSLTPTRLPLNSNPSEMTIRIWWDQQRVWFKKKKKKTEFWPFAFKRGINSFANFSWRSQSKFHTENPSHGWKRGWKTVSGRVCFDWNLVFFYSHTQNRLFRIHTAIISSVFVKFWVLC